MTEEILKVLRELQGSVNDIQQRGVDPLKVPGELQSGASVTPEARRKALKEYTGRVYEKHPSTWTAEQKALVREQINNVLASL